MKLELKHIQHYPIGGENALRVNVKRNRYPESEEIVALSSSIIALLEKPMKVLYTIQPLLRPMSDLYKEIDGKVGIVELAKISIDIPTVEVWLDIEVGKVFFKLQGETYEFGLLAKTGDFFSSCPHIYNSLKCFAYLFSNHYDVFGLIDKGLAIDINTLNPTI